jgi:hypothetical protein
MPNGEKLLFDYQMTNRNVAEYGHWPHAWGFDTHARAA